MEAGFRKISQVISALCHLSALTQGSFLAGNVEGGGHEMGGEADAPWAARPALGNLGLSVTPAS